MSPIWPNPIIQKSFRATGLDGKTGSSEGTHLLKVFIALSGGIQNQLLEMTSGQFVGELDQIGCSVMLFSSINHPLT